MHLDFSHLDKQETLIDNFTWTMSFYMRSDNRFGGGFGGFWGGGGVLWRANYPLSAWKFQGVAESKTAKNR